MRSFLIQLARLGGSIALEHFRPDGGIPVDSKGRGDYVTHVDRRVEEVITTRIAKHYPDHLVFGEEMSEQWPTEHEGPCWVIDPIDGTTNFVRGMPGWAISIAFCDHHAEPRHGVVYDPVRDEVFIGERGAGLWLNEQRVDTSGQATVEGSIISVSLPFRNLEALDDVSKVVTDQQRVCDDIRRSGSAALDLAYVACGRTDAYWELGIYPWDVAAGELLVRCGGGVVSDFTGREDGLLAHRSVIAAASAPLHENLVTRLASLTPWLTRAPYVR